MCLWRSAPAAHHIAARVSSRPLAAEFRVSRATAPLVNDRTRISAAEEERRVHPWRVGGRRLRCHGQSLRGRRRAGVRSDCPRATLGTPENLSATAGSRRSSILSQRPASARRSRHTRSVFLASCTPARVQASKHRERQIGMASRNAHRACAAAAGQFGDCACCACARMRLARG